MTERNDEFFGNEETASSDLPRYAINAEGAGKGETPTLAMVEGIYEDSICQTIEGKDRLLHQIKPRKPIDGKERILVWGNHQLDSSLPSLAPGTKVRITYKGVRNLKGGRTLKEIEVLFPAKATRRLNPFKEITAAAEAEAREPGAD
jgi:hypothetical protein